MCERRNANRVNLDESWITTQSSRRVNAGRSPQRHGGETIGHYLLGLARAMHGALSLADTLFLQKKMNGEFKWPDPRHLEFARHSDCPPRRNVNRFEMLISETNIQPATTRYAQDAAVLAR